MNNENYSFSGLDAGFHINISKEATQLPPAFQNENSAFPQSSFGIQAEDCYPNMTSNSATKEPNGVIFNPSSQLTHTSVNNPVSIVPGQSAPVCGIYDGLGLNDGNTVLAPIPSDPNSQPYCSGNQVTANSSFAATAHQPAQFICNTVQAQEFSGHYEPREFASQSNVFQNNAAPIQQPDTASIGQFSNAEFVNSNVNTTAYYPQINVANDVGTNVYPFPANESYAASSFQRQDEFPAVSTSTFPPCNTDSTFSIHSVTEADTQSHHHLSNEPMPDSNSDPKDLYSRKNESFEKHATVGSVEAASEQFNLCQPEQIPQDEDQPLSAENVESEHAGVNSFSEENHTERAGTDTIFPTDSVSPSEAGDELSGVNSVVPVATAVNEDLTSPQCLENNDLVDPSNYISTGEKCKEVHEGAVCTDSEDGTGVTLNQNKDQDDPSNHISLGESSKEVCEGRENNVDISEEGMRTTPNQNKDQEKVDPTDAQNSNTSKPLSPMITLLDNDWEDGETKPQSAASRKAEDQGKGPKIEENVRLTRTRTGALRNKPQHLMYESDDSSQDSIPFEDWDFEEGSEIAPSKAHPYITVPEDVLNITKQEMAYYMEQFPYGVEGVLQMRLDCTACGKHIGASPNYVHLGNRHKVLRVLICNQCRKFYGAGKFPRDSDGSELYCRWCGQGGKITCCSSCPNVFCEPCIGRNFGSDRLKGIAAMNDWACFICNYKELWQFRAVCWALLSYSLQKKKEVISGGDSKKLLSLQDDKSKCCESKRFKKRKPPRNPKASGTSSNYPQNSANSEGSSNYDNFQFGHFLFGNEDFSVDSSMETQDTPAEEDEFIDPSQFVQPVLEERNNSPARNRTAPSLPVINQLSPLPRAPSTAPRLVQAVPIRLNTPGAPNILHVRNASGAQPRIIIRQGNLMQPGLVPINFQPNSMPMSGRPARPTAGIRNNFSTTSQVTSSRLPPRNQGNLLNNVDGVRSLDQLQSLEHVPWFRDGIDNIRAVGFALSRRLRELEARFHSLKNKHDVDKVMILGKKLERLAHSTQKRFQQINVQMSGSCRNWYMKKTNQPKFNNMLNPFSFYSENDSDWDDERELSRPLEKVMIPVSSSDLQRATLIRPQTRPIASPSTSHAFGRAQPSLSRRTHIPPLPRQSLGGVSNPVSNVRVHPSQFARVPTSIPNMRVQSRPLQSLLLSSVNPLRARMPGPKSVLRPYIQNPISSGILPGTPPRSLGAYLNQRNGPNTISVSVTSSAKRKRRDSDGSDIIVCPTEPELLRRFEVKPCQVNLEKCDEFIVSFLLKQSQNRIEKEINEEISVSQGTDGSLAMSEVEPAISQSIPDPIAVLEEENVILENNPCEDILMKNGEEVIAHGENVSQEKENVKVNSVGMNNVVDDDDDIEIINEVDLVKEDSSAQSAQPSQTEESVNELPI